MAIPENRIQTQVALCMSLMSKYVEPFSDWMLSGINNHFISLLNSMINTKDEQAAYYSLICLKYIIKRYQKKPEDFRKDPQN